VKVRGWLYSEPNLALIAAADAADELEGLAQDLLEKWRDGQMDVPDAVYALREHVAMLRSLA
jgi:hypothetical protein